MVLGNKFEKADRSCGESGNVEFRPASEFTKIPNWVLDSVMGCNGLGAVEFRVMLFILRKTIGWHKDEDFLSLSQIAFGANCTRAGALKAIRFWEHIGVISCLPVGKRRMNLIRLREDKTVREVLDGILVRNSDRLGERSLRRARKLRSKHGLVS